MACPIISDTRTIRQVLNTFSSLPYNQRNYVWKPEHVTLHYKDLYSKYMHNAEYNYLGSVIYLKKAMVNNFVMNGKAEYEIWDGQQRLFTTYLILCALYRKFGDATKYLRQNILYDINDIKMKMVSIKQKLATVNTDGKSYVLKFHTVYEHDMTAIKSIIDGTYLSIYEFLEPNNKNLGQDSKIKCNCEYTYVGKNADDAIEKFKAHCQRSHNYRNCGSINGNDNSASHIYNAFETIMEHLHLSHFNALDAPNDIHEFITYILDKTGINVQETSSKSIASEMFDKCNNRGVQVCELEVLKNYLLSIVKDSNCDRYFDLWNHKYKEYNTKKYNIYGKLFMNNLIRSSIYTLLNTIYDHLNLNDLFDIYIETYGQTENVIDDLFAQCDTNIKHISSIMISKYGAILYPTRKTDSIPIDMSVLFTIILPLFNKFNDINKKSHNIILEIMTRTHIRACVVNTKGANFLNDNNSYNIINTINTLLLSASNNIDGNILASSVHDNIFCDNKWGDYKFGESLKALSIGKKNNTDMKLVSTLLRFYEASTRALENICLADTIAVSMLDAEDDVEYSIGNYILVCHKKRMSLYSDTSFKNKIDAGSTEQLYTTKDICAKFKNDKKHYEPHEFIKTNRKNIIYNLKKNTNIVGLHF